MTADPLTAVLDQLAAHREQLTQLDDREAAHFAAVGERLTQLAALITTMGRTLADDTAALARLEALDRQVTELAAGSPARAPTARTGHQPGPAPAWWTLTPAERKPADRRAAGLGRPGVPARLRPPGRHPRPLLAGPRPVPVRAGHRSASCGERCTSSPPAAPALLSAQAEYQARILPALAAQLMTETTGCDHTRRSPRIHPEHAMTNPALRQALAYAERGWPVFPCLPGQKIPATRHGYLDATTDQQQITEWFARQGGWNLAIATGAPGPDVLDVDQHGPAGNGFSAFARLRAAGLLDGRQRLRPHPQRRPARLLHRLGPAQRPPARPASGLPVRRRLRAGPAIAGPRQALSAHQDPRRPGGLDWQAVIRLLEPDRQYQQPATRPLPDYGITRLVRWVAAQPEGNRNAGLFWAANRALDADPAADLNELAAAARQAGLPEQEITRTLNSARRTRHAAPNDPGRQAEGAS